MPLGAASSCFGVINLSPQEKIHLVCNLLWKGDHSRSWYYIMKAIFELYCFWGACCVFTVFQIECDFEKINLPAWALHSKETVLQITFSKETGLKHNNSTCAGTVHQGFSYHDKLHSLWVVEDPRLKLHAGTTAGWQKCIKVLFQQQNQKKAFCFFLPNVFCLYRSFCRKHAICGCPVVPVGGGIGTVWT